MARRKSSQGPLPLFEGLDVVTTKVIIKNTGDGLSQAMAIEPQVIAVFDRKFVVLEVECDAVNHRRVKDTEVLERVVVLKAETATFVDEHLVKDVLDAQRLAIEKAKGLERLDFGEPDPDAPENPDGPAEVRDIR